MQVSTLRYPGYLLSLSFHSDTLPEYLPYHTNHTKNIPPYIEYLPGLAHPRHLCLHTCTHLTLPFITYPNFHFPSPSRSPQPTYLYPPNTTFYYIHQPAFPTLYYCQGLIKYKAETTYQIRPKRPRTETTKTETTQAETTRGRNDSGLKRTVPGSFATFLFATYTCSLPDLFATYTFATYTRSLPSVFATCIFRYPDFFQANIRKAGKVRFYCILFLLIYLCILPIFYNIEKITGMSIIKWASAWQNKQNDLCAQQWLIYQEAQFDLSLRWAHRPFCWFYRAASK